MKRMTLKFVIILLLPPFFCGCVGMALRLSPSLLPNLTQTFFEECDSDLARQSLPADLKLMEGLLKNAPDNRRLLTSLSMGFTGYAMLFVEDEDEERASLFYIRARDYGIRGLGPKGLFLKKSGLNEEDIRADLSRLGEKEVEALFWTIMAWNSWINLNLDKPTALAELTITQPCLERILQIKPDFFYGAPHVLMGTLLAARPALMGGNAGKAKKCFEEAMEIGQGRFFLVHYYFARYYAVRTQNRQLFISLLQDVIQGHPDELKDACLINTVMKQKAIKLLAESDDLFF